MASLVQLLSLGLLLSWGSPGADPYPRRVGIDIERYRFDLELRDDTDEITGRATVTVRFTQDGVTELPLDLVSRSAEGQGMRVSSVSSGGTDLGFTHSDDLLTIALAEPSREGSRVDVHVEYSGIPASGLRIGPNKYGDRTFFSDNWPNRARNWLPTVDHIAEKAKVEFVVTAPAHYQVVSNGVLVEETDRLDGTRLTHWRHSVPISPWLYVLGVARFAVQQVDDFEGKPIQTWVYSQDRDAWIPRLRRPDQAGSGVLRRVRRPVRLREAGEHHVDGHRRRDGGRDGDHVQRALGDRRTLGPLAERHHP